MAAHAVWLDRDDMRRIAVAHSPGSNARPGNDLATFRALLDAGVSVGIGTDACTCSDTLNMLEAMRIASMVSRVRKPDPENRLATDGILALATRGSSGVPGAPTDTTLPTPRGATACTHLVWLFVPVMGLPLGCFPIHSVLER